MSSYQQEQIEALRLVRRHLAQSSDMQRRQLGEEIRDYLLFRRAVDAFLVDHFSAVCTQKCYQSRLSACCTRDGIITFFGDVVVNALVSGSDELDALQTVLEEQHSGFKCVYLSPKGCLWHLKPIVCEMFVCDPAQKEIFTQTPGAEQAWRALRRREKAYRWPDRPVLFDYLEQVFMDAGYTSTLMYLHNSPGLLRVKRRANENDSR
jgi:hypothetical protein